VAAFFILFVLDLNILLRLTPYFMMFLSAFALILIKSFLWTQSLHLKNFKLKTLKDSRNNQRKRMFRGRQLWHWVVKRLGATMLIFKSRLIRFIAFGGLFLPSNSTINNNNTMGNMENNQIHAKNACSCWKTNFVHNVNRCN
jgi:hypothetical protein